MCIRDSSLSVCFHLCEVLINAAATAEHRRRLEGYESFSMRTLAKLDPTTIIHTLLPLFIHDLSVYKNHLVPLALFHRERWAHKIYFYVRVSLYVWLPFSKYTRRITSFKQAAKNEFFNVIIYIINIQLWLQYKHIVTKKQTTFSQNESLNWDKHRGRK